MLRPAPAQPAESHRTIRRAPFRRQQTPLVSPSRDRPYLLQDTDSLYITIWNKWGDPYINPLTHLRLDANPTPDSNGCWHYTGTVYRIMGSGKPRHVESCTKIAETPNPDFTITDSTRSTRYRLSPKIPRKP